MILKVAIPGKMQFKMIRREPSFLLSGQGDIHYIGGARYSPRPLNQKKKMKSSVTWEQNMKTKQKIFSLNIISDLWFT